MTAFGAGGDVATDAKREWSHHFTFGADLVLYSWLIWTVADGAARRQHHGLGTWGPVGLVVVGCALTLLDITRHVLLDHGGVLFEEKTLAMYNNAGGLSPAGRFCQISTVVGLTLMICGIIWFLGIPGKLFGKVGG